MDKRGFWRRKLDSVQEWSSVERGCVPIVLAGLVYLQYALWGLFALAHDNADALVDPDFLAFQGRFAGAIILSAALLLVAGRSLNRRQPHALWFQHLGANFYGLSLVWGVYLTGTLSLTTGIVLAGAPLLGFLLLDRRVMLGAIALTFGAILVLNLLSAYGVLPYAPALRVPADSAGALFWVGSHLAFAAPHLVVNTALSAILLDQWRRREARVLALSLTDPLTQVHNRRHILEQLEAEAVRARRDGTPLAVAVLDLDHFKQINDRFGHPAGDYVLQEAARALKAALRGQDAVGRLGGEEFLVILPATGADVAAQVMEGCRQGIAELVIPAEGGGLIPVTASFGIACCDTRMEPVGAALVQAADSALYAAKRGGRNRVHVADRATVAAAVDTDAGQFVTTHIRRRPVNQPWWQSQSGWRQQAARILEWSPLDKVSLILGLLLLMQACLLLGVLVNAARPGAVALADIGVARTLLWAQFAQGCAALLLLGVARQLRRRQAEAPWFEPLALQFCGLALVSMGYGAGILSVSTGVILTGGPLVCFMLFRRGVVLAAFGTALAGVVVLAYAAALGRLPYAPLVSFAGPAWQPSGPYWVLVNYLLFLPVLAGGLVLADQILGRWREREERIRHMGLTDALTGVHNRRSILGLLDRHLREAVRDGQPLAVVIIDLDHFKLINDNHGHYAGDRVLQGVTRVMRAALREGDAVGRFGGEEFLAVLPGTGLQEAVALAEQCRALIAAAEFSGEHGEPLRVTASFGLAAHAPAGQGSADLLIRLADDALYLAKESGRNRVQAGAASAA